MRATFFAGCRGLAIATTALLAGCLGGSGGGSAPQFIGGAPDASCNADYHTQGCFVGTGTPTRVECQKQADGSAKWVKIDECKTGEYCTEEAQQGAAQPTMMNAVCKVIPQSGGGGGGGGGAGSTDGGPAKTPAQEIACVEQQCASEIAACMANAKCATLLGCAKACQDEACREACGSTLSEADFAEILVLFGPLDTCGKAKDCISDCGNGKCQAGENATTCAEDCGPKTVCGNGTCEAGETTDNCAQDCKTGGGAVCGNGTCESGETEAACPQDCKGGGGAATCGDAKCDTGENATCPIDCDSVWVPQVACAKEKCASTFNACASDAKCLTFVNCYAACGADGSEACVNACITAAGGAAMSKASALQACIAESCTGATGPVCGDGKCEGTESDTCAKDCAGGPVCGNGTCESGESTSTCPADCKAGAVCGNEICESGENYTNCKLDCPCTADSQCGSGKKCVEGQCVTSGGGTATCGDFVCASGENCTMDCNSDAKAAAQCTQSACSSQWNSCKGNSGCWDAFVCMNQCGESQSCIEGCAGKAGAGLNTLISLGQCADSKCGGSSGPVCGNGTCESGETTSNCPTDCKAAGTCSSNIDCPSGQSCVSGKCQSSGGGSCAQTCPTDTTCQNGVCTKVTSGSCVGACGGESPDGCWCDQSCQDQYFDCCPDIKLVCTP